MKQANTEGHLGNSRPARLGETDFLARYVTWALWALALIVCIATVTGQIESFNGLYIWFSTHGITGFWADFAPLMVDSFTVVGELAIFAGISRHWEWKSRILPWVSALIGIGASVAANVGDKIGHPVSWELTAAIPPLAGAFGIVIGLGVLKRVARDWAERRAVKTIIKPDEVAAQLFKDNEELARALQIERDKTHLHDTLTRWKEEGKMDAPRPAPDQELKGMDVLIPPKPEDRWPDGVVVGTQAIDPQEEVQAHVSDIRPGRQVISADGLDPYATGSFPAIRG